MRIAPCLALTVVLSGLAVGLKAEETSETTTGIVVGPWVNSVTDTTAKVVWAGGPKAGNVSVKVSGRESAEAEVKVALSTSPISGLDYRLHVASLTGLKPLATYDYVVTSGGARSGGSFTTALPKGVRKPFRFLAYSDPQTYPERHRKVAEAARKDGPFAFLAISGDLAEDGSDWSDMTDHFFAPARELLRETALWTARGNHEKDGILYRDLFVLPGNEYYYSFDFGNLHYVMLDCYQPGSTRHREGEELTTMLAWLDRDLAAAKAWADWIIVSYHDPTFNAGARGSAWGRDTVLPVLEKHEVDLVLCGHSHIYERCVPIGPKGAKPIIHITHGGGGGPTYNTTVSPIIAATYGGLHYCDFRINGSRLLLVAKTPEGKVIDRLSLTKAAGRYPGELLNSALTTEEAVPLVKIFKLLPATVGELPVAGKPLPLTVDGSWFPGGSSLTIAPAADSPWTFEPLTFEPTEKPVTLVAMPPPDVKMAVTPWMGHFDPELKVRIEFTLRGNTMSHDGIPVLIPADIVRRIVPVPPAVNVPRAKSVIAVDGKPDDWTGIAALRLPSSDKPSPVLRMAWRTDGLYGMATVVDADIKSNRSEPWSGDAVEICLELDKARRFGLRATTPAGRFFLLPGGNGGGVATVRKMSGGIKTDEVRAIWRPTVDGYRIEFVIEAEALAPARLKAGTTLGFQYAQRNGGRVVEQFADNSRFASWGAPVFWGRVTLGDGSSPERNEP